MGLDFFFLILCFFAIALVYSSVGFGGGSSYLALLALSGLSLDIIRPTALLCNIIVVTGSVWIFWRSGALPWRKAIPFAIVSVPMAFVGGSLTITSERDFFMLLGVCLLLAALLLWAQPHARKTRAVTGPMLEALIGGGIGFLSGFVGIGGGIFLSPVLHLLRWGPPREISAIASVFILVNSIGGLAGQLTATAAPAWDLMLPLAGAVLIGGQIGARLGARRFNPVFIKRITAVVIFAAAIRILIDQH